MYLQASLPHSLSHFVCYAFIVLFLTLWIMESQTRMIDNAAISKNQRLVRIRQKIKDVFGWDCTMNDDMLVKYYSITIDGELVMILK
jgi:hypothetical protein